MSQQVLNDPAIIASAQHPSEKPPAKNPRQQQQPPHEVPFVTPVIVLNKTTETVGEGDEAKEETVFSPSVIWRERAVLHTIDDKLCSVPRSVVALMPEVKENATETEGDIVEFKYPLSSLMAITAWIESKGFDGKTNGGNFHTPVTHTDFSHLLTDKWEKAYWHKVLLPEHHTSTESIFGAINYAEKHGMEGLLEFSVVCLSCAIRGESDDSILHTMGLTELSKEEKEAAHTAYPWLKDAVSPK